MSKEAMKLALEALEDVQYYYGWGQTERDYDARTAAITALREALAEQPAQQEERIKIELAMRESSAIRDRLIQAGWTPPAQQEPVAWKLVPTEPTEEMLKAMDECSKEGYDERLYAGHAASVYMAAVDAAPTPPAQRKPLTDEELYKVFPAIATYTEANKTLYRSIARAIEAAHGIKP